MTTFVSDAFTDTAGTVVTSHTGATGATWTMGTGYNSANLPVISDANRLRGGASGAGTGCSVFASGVGTVDGGYTEAIIETKTNVAGFGIFVRGYANSGGAARGYLAYYGTSGAWQIYRLDNSATLTAIGSGTTSLLSVGSHTLRITATGTGASVALEVKLDGSVLLSASDTGGSRITTFGSAGVFTATTASNTAGTHIDSIIGVDPGISIATPVAGKIHQRSGTTGTITVTGTYTGTPTTIEARLVDDGTSTPVSGFDWATKVASPSGSAYSFSFTSVPQGGWYNVQVRHSNNTGVTATSGKVGVGALIALTGQSNAYLWFRSRSTALTPNSLVRAFGIFGTWSVPDTGAMAGAIAFGNALATDLGIPVGVLDYAADSSYLHNYSSNSWLPISNAPYVAFKAGALTGLDGKLEAIVWVQGESDVIQNATQAQYYADLGTLFTAFRTDSGQSTLPVIMVTLGRWLNDVRVTNTNIQDVRLAQVQKCADSNVYRVDRMDLPLSGDDLHLSGPGFETLGTRCAQVVSYLAGVVTYYQGPRISSVTQVSTSVYDVNLTHNSSATDFTPTSGITGFRVLDAGTPATISSAVRQTASSVRLTLSAPAGALPTIQYLYGYGPDITGVLVDNAALTLPLEFNGGVTALVHITADASITQAGNTSTADSSLSVVADAAVTQSGNTLSSTATLASDTITANANITQDSNTSDSALALLLAASADVTQGSNTTVADGALSVAVDASITQADNTATAVGVLLIAAAASLTQTGNSLTSTATLASDTITANANITQDNNSISADGVLTVAAGASITQDGNTITFDSDLLIAANASMTQVGNTLASTAGSNPWTGETVRMYSPVSMTIQMSSYI